MVASDDPVCVVDVHGVLASVYFHDAHLRLPWWCGSSSRRSLRLFDDEAKYVRRTIKLPRRRLLGFRYRRSLGHLSIFRFSRYRPCDYVYISLYLFSNLFVIGAGDDVDGARSKRYS